MYFIVFPGKLSYPSYFRNNFHIWHYLQNSFKIYRNEKCFKKYTARGEQTKKNSSKLQKPKGQLKLFSF